MSSDLEKAIEKGLVKKGNEKLKRSMQIEVD